MGLFFISQNSKSYDDKTTHPALTDEIVDFYNLSFGDKLTAEEKEWIVQGAMDEDTPPRWINHFYDPIYKVGWSGENTGIWPTMMVQYFSSGALSNENPVDSLNWLHNQELQAKYGAYNGNRTWERAIYEAVKNGDKKEAYYTLGYILHLIEDATVPDHTRNDTHAHELQYLTGDYGSPYEEFAKQFKRDNLDIAKELKQINETPINKSSIDEYLISLAEYSNKYFFSKDTIDNSKYKFPKIIRTDNNFGYGKDENGVEFSLVRAKVTLNNFGKINITYSLNDKKETEILTNYFSRLSRQAVLSGAGVINLFKQEVARAEKDKLKDLPAESASIWSITGRYFQIQNALTSAYQTITNTLSGIFAMPPPEMLTAQLSNVGGDANISSKAPPLAQISSTPVSLPQSASTSPAVVFAPTNQINNTSPTQSLAPILPATDSEARFPNSVATSSATTTIVVVTTTTTAATSSYQGNGYVSGVSTADALLATNAAAHAEQQQVNFSESDSTTTDETLSNSATSTDSSATSTDSTFNNASSTDAVSATSTEQTIIATTTTSTLPDILPGYHPAPVVINEVAWMGTQAQANDEWIELYNKTNQPIDLTGWTLENSNQSLKINLKGVIQARSYFLLERTASTTTDQEEDMVYTGAMPNSGQVANLYLRNASSSVIDHIHRWYAGDNNLKSTMERISPYVRGEAQYNWGNYTASTSTSPFAKDAEGNDIFGTPKAKNSVSTYTPVIDQINQDITWYKELSPYRAVYKIGVAKEAVLTIQPGVTAKFTNGTGLEISGVLRAEGAESDPIIFTSNSQTPKPGDWLNIIFFNSSQISKLEYVQVRYGGQGTNHNPNIWAPTYTGAISIINSNPEISNSTFDQNLGVGIYIAGASNPKISNNMVGNTSSPSGYWGAPTISFGIQLVDGNAAAEISGNTIESNSIGIKSASASTTPLVIKDNIFANNGVNGEFQTNTFLNIDNSGNQDRNKQSGFRLIADFNSDYASVIKKDAVPYMVSDMLIRASSTVIVEPGVVFKNSGGYYGISKWSIKGSLKAKGTQDQPIIFTSAGDGVDGYNNGSKPNPGDWNRLHFEGDGASQSEIDYSVFRYGDKKYDACPWAVLGGPCWKYDGVVLIENSSPTITNSIFEFNNQPDIKIRGASSPTLESNVIDQIIIE